MGKYCKHYRKFSSGTVVTDITIPPSCGKRFVPFVFQTVTNYGGKIEESPTFEADGSILLKAIIFSSDDGREKCCKEIERSINTILEKQKSISIEPVEGTENMYKVKLNTPLLFIQFQDIIKKINPMIEFIDNNGGWFDAKTNTSPGYNALAKALNNHTLNKKQKEEISSALDTFLDFMGSYVVGSYITGDIVVTIASDNK